MKTIPLTRGQVAIVDDEDYSRLSHFYWQADKRKYGWYVKTRIIKPDGKSQSVYMHRMVLSIEHVDRKTAVDHIDHNGLNNQKENLRLCSNSENLMNMRPRKGASKYKGVYRDESNIKWVAQIREGKGLALGTYSNEDDAARAYNIAAKELFGEFAFYNDVPDPFRIPEQRLYTSNFRGVCLYKRTHRWKAKICKDGIAFHLGYFNDEHEAAKAYDRSARQMFGSKAILNFTT